MARQMNKDRAVPQPPSPTSEPAPSTGLSRSAIIIGFVSLLSDISTEMAYPLLPLFLTQTLGAPKTIVGLIEGLAVGTASIVASLSGWISDRLGRRKPVAFIGYALTTVAKPLIAWATAWPIVMGARFADRFGKGIRGAPKDALLAETTSPAQRGRAYGFERTMDFTGAVMGPLAGLALVGWASLDVRTVFLISTIPALLAALLILSLKESRTVSTSARSLRYSLAGTTPEYRKLLLIAAVFSLANSANAFLILRAESLGLATGRTILAYTLYNLVSAVAALPAGAASDRLGRRNLLIIGYGVYALAYAGFGAANQAWMVWPLFALYGLFPALTDGVAKAMIVDTAGSAGRATAIGVYAMVVGLTQILASVIGGLLWDKVNASMTFYFGAGLAAVAAFLLFRLFPKHKPKVS